MMKRPAWLLAAALLGPTLLPAFAGIAARAAEKPRATFDCVMHPALKIKLGSPMRGLLARVVVDRGDIVTRGTLIAEIDSSVEKATVELNRVRAQNTANIEARLADLALSRKRLKRTGELARRRVVPLDRLDERRAQVAVAQANLKQARGNQRLARLEHKRAIAILERRRITSPIDGVVVERLLYQGEFVSQEAHIVTIAQIDPLHVEAFVPTRYFFLVKKGMKASVKPKGPVHTMDCHHEPVLVLVVNIESADARLRQETRIVGYRVAVRVVTERIKVSTADNIGSAASLVGWRRPFLLSRCSY